jgi:hypothetical protein
MIKKNSGSGKIKHTEKSIASKSTDNHVEDIIREPPTNLYTSKD